MTLPSSTYRLQITPQFTLFDAADLCGHLADLGVGAVYLSPILASTPGSDHGYDIVDPTIIDPQRGGEEGWASFVKQANLLGLGIVLDIVPNHLGVADPQSNPSWWSVLRDGQDSPYSQWYDIDWSRGRITLPILGDDPESLTIVDGPGGPQLGYHEHRFPIADGTHQPGDDAATVHDRQHYRLMHWRTADDELTYRRFFAVTQLAGVRQEDPTVFHATHQRIAELSTQVTGFRVDHPDGLTDPEEYLRRLHVLAPHHWLLVEKILEPGEEIPDWPIHGTTGYDAMREINNVLVDPITVEDFSTVYWHLTSDSLSFRDHVVGGKRHAAHGLFRTESRRIARLAPEQDTEQLAEALRELAVHVDVYRSYLPFGVGHLNHALGVLRADRPDLADRLTPVVDRLHDADDELAQRFQQLTGAVMAKGVEDTAWYRYNRFVGLNEVGGDPGTFGSSIDEFHALQQQRQVTWPHSMTSLSTHDTKRGEDIRARLAVLSEMPAIWRSFVVDWMSHSTNPDRSLAYLIAQTLVAAGTIDRERMHDYVIKAMREQSTRTSWTDPDADFEAAVLAEVDDAYDNPDRNVALARMWAVIDQPGWCNGLSSKLIQLTMPGIPDVYQGTELWDNALVDPDNRRPVDHDLRRRMLAGIDASFLPRCDESGEAKLWVTTQALRTRRDHPGLFTSYTPVYASGPQDHHLIGFDRGGAITLATRLPYRLGEDGGWQNTTVTLPTGRWHDVLSNDTWSGTVDLGELLHQYPVSLLIRS